MVPAGDDLGAHRANGEPGNASLRAGTLSGLVGPAVAGNGHVNGAGTGTAVTANATARRGDDDAGTITAARLWTETAARKGTGTVPDLTAALLAAHAARDRLLERGEALTRDTLAAQLRRDGYPMRNARVSLLLAALRQEVHAVPAARCGTAEADARRYIGAGDHQGPMMDL